jgi:hypothetical protein
MGWNYLFTECLVDLPAKAIWGRRDLCRAIPFSGSVASIVISQSGSLLVYTILIL